MSKYEIENSVNHRRIKPLSSNQARAVGSFLGLSIIVLSQAAPKIEPMINEFIISSNVNDYLFETKTNNGEICYTKDSPTLSNALQDTVFHNAYCPTVIDGRTKFIELILPTKSLSKFPKKIEER